MIHKRLRGVLSKKRNWFFLGILSFVVVALVLSSCGGSNTNGTTMSFSSAQQSANQRSAAGATVDQPASNQASDGKQTANNQQSTIVGKQYLVKTLKVTLQVQDTRKVATLLQRWFTNKDKNITSSGSNYQQTYNDTYSVSLTFSVPATDYDDVYAYLRDYTTQNDGRLTGFNESVQDVTNNYIDVDSRLSNLRKEQTRLQDLLSHAQALGDILSIESKLTEVEGDIESYQAQKNALTSQISFYDVTINLDPLTATTEKPTSSQGWSIGRIFQDAFNASLTVAQNILTLLIWLVAFSLYLLPVAAITWGVRRWRRMHRRSMPQPKATLATEAANAPPVE